MSLLEELEIQCPYCGSPFAIEAEPALEDQQFIEDCPVCCAPIEFELRAESDGGWRLSARRDDD
ncbi:MAG TPA: CPXCG motif-containing cysteine-rich protein [Gammaproteobacteria bacterium]